MNIIVRNFLKRYSCEERAINRLLVSAYLKRNGITVEKNILILNYLIYNTDSDYPVLQQFLSILNQLDESFGIEYLIDCFEFVVSPSTKEVNGAVYPPLYIREYIIETVLADKSNKSLANLSYADICCGCGGFFITITDYIRKRVKISCEKLFKCFYGFDIEPYSIERTKILLALYALSVGEDIGRLVPHLFVGDSLTKYWENLPEFQKKHGFDVIVGNPPYVSSSKLSNDTRDKLRRWTVSDNGKADLYIPFFQIATESLAPAGTLGIITVNNFVRSVNGRGVRRYFSLKQLTLKIIDFGSKQVFKGRSTYTCICIIKNKNGKLAYHKCLPSELKNIKDFNEFDYAEFDWKKGWLLANDNTVLTNIQHIQRAGVPLESLVDIKNGFATLRNDVFVLTPTEEDESYYYVEKNGKYYSVEKAICRKAIKPNAISDEINIEKYIYPLIFPYQKRGSLIKIIDEKKLKKLYPKTYDYLSDFKEVLIKRDKGNRQYAAWYAYGRTQALRLEGYKLFFPYMASHPVFILSEDKQLLFYNGYALVSKDLELLRLLKKILSSSVFWYYVQHHSKPYGSDYMALSKNYIRDFGIPKLTRKQTNKLLTMEVPEEIDRYLEKLYKIKI